MEEVDTTMPLVYNEEKGYWEYCEKRRTPSGGKYYACRTRVLRSIEDERVLYYPDYIVRYYVVGNILSKLRFIPPGPLTEEKIKQLITQLAVELTGRGVKIKMFCFSKRIGSSKNPEELWSELEHVLECFDGWREDVTIAQVFDTFIHAIAYFILEEADKFKEVMEKEFGASVLDMGIRVP